MQTRIARSVGTLIRRRPHPRNPESHHHLDSKDTKVANVQSYRCCSASFLTS